MTNVTVSGWQRVFCLQQSTTKYGRIQRQQRFFTRARYLCTGAACPTVRRITRIRGCCVMTRGGTKSNRQCSVWPSKFMRILPHPYRDSIFGVGGMGRRTSAKSPQRPLRGPSDCGRSQRSSFGRWRPFTPPEKTDTTPRQNDSTHMTHCVDDWIRGVRRFFKNSSPFSSPATAATQSLICLHYAPL